MNKIPPHPFPGQSREVVYVYWSFCPPSMACHSRVIQIVHVALASLWKCAGLWKVLLYQFWRTLPAIFREDSSGHLSHQRNLTAPVLQKTFADFFFEFPWGFGIEKCFGDFQWSPSLRRYKERKTLKQFEGKLEQYSVRKLEKVRKLSFCSFSDLKISVLPKNGW